MVSFRGILSRCSTRSMHGRDHCAQQQIENRTRLTTARRCADCQTNHLIRPSGDYSHASRARQRAETDNNSSSDIDNACINVPAWIGVLTGRPAGIFFMNKTKKTEIVKEIYYNIFSLVVC